VTDASRTVVVVAVGLWIVLSAPLSARFVRQGYRRLFEAFLDDDDPRLERLLDRVYVAALWVVRAFGVAFPAMVLLASE